MYPVPDRTFAHFGSGRTFVRLCKRELRSGSFTEMRLFGEWILRKLKDRVDGGLTRFSVQAHLIGGRVENTNMRAWWSGELTTRLRKPGGMGGQPPIIHLPVRQRPDADTRAPNSQHELLQLSGGARICCTSVQDVLETGAGIQGVAPRNARADSTGCYSLVPSPPSH